MLSVTEFRTLLMLADDRNTTVDDLASGLNVSRFVAAALIESLRREGFMDSEPLGEHPPRFPSSHSGMRDTALQPSVRSQT